MRRRKNLVGTQVKTLRCARKWTQNDLATKLQISGWDVSRSGVARIESRETKIGDFEVLFLKEVFKVDLKELYPSVEPEIPVYSVLAQEGLANPS